MGTHRRTPEKLAEVDRLTRTGWTVVAACAHVGLDPQTWYRRRRPEIERDQAQAVLDVVAALRQRVA
jgi:hypothetical protein